MFYSLAYGLGQQGIYNAAHLGGLVGGFVMGLLLSRPLDPEKRTGPSTGQVFRATLFSVAVLALLAVPVVHPSQAIRKEQEFRRDMILCWRCDNKTSEAFRVMLDEGKMGKITPAVLADRIEKELLPMWDGLESRLSKDPLDKGSALHDLQLAYLQYAQTTSQGVKLCAEGIRDNSMEKIQQSNEVFASRNAVVEQMKKLNTAAQ